MNDRIDRVKYIDKNGRIQVLTKQVGKKKINSQFPIVYTDFGIYLLLPLLVLGGGGHFADTYFDTKPVFTLAGIVLGGITAIINLYRLLKKDGSSRTAR